MHEQGRDVCLEQGIEVSMGLYFRRGKLSADVKGNCCSGLMGRADEAATHLVQQDDTRDNVQEGKGKINQQILLVWEQLIFRTS